MNRTPKCNTCGASLSGARLVIDRQWACPDCAYELEYGPTERTTRSRAPSRRHQQDEGLFPLPLTRHRGEAGSIATETPERR
jgi:hypothetical protein